MGEPTREVRLTGAARRDLLAVLTWSMKEFGERAALCYDALIKQALKDIGENPDRPGSRARDDIATNGVRTYHFSFSRSRVGGVTVKPPRHLLLYRPSGKGVIEVGRILHDSRELRRHLPQNYGSGPSAS